MKLIKKNWVEKWPQKSQIIAMTLRCAMMKKFGLEIPFGVIKKQFQLCLERRRWWWGVKKACWSTCSWKVYDVLLARSRFTLRKTLIEVGFSSEVNEIIELLFLSLYILFRNNISISFFYSHRSITCRWEIWIFDKSVIDELFSGKWRVMRPLKNESSHPLDITFYLIEMRRKFHHEDAINYQTFSV